MFLFVLMNSYPATCNIHQDVGPDNEVMASKGPRSKLDHDTRARRQKVG